MRRKTKQGRALGQQETRMGWTVRQVLFVLLCLRLSSKYVTSLVSLVRAYLCTVFEKFCVFQRLWLLSVRNDTRNRYGLQTATLKTFKVTGKDKGHPITGHEHPEGEERRSSTLSLTSALDGPRSGRFSSGEWPRTHCIGGWVGPRIGLDGCGKFHLPPGFDLRTSNWKLLAKCKSCVSPIIIFIKWNKFWIFMTLFSVLSLAKIIITYCYILYLGFSVFLLTYGLT